MLYKLSKLTLASDATKEKAPAQWKKYQFFKSSHVYSYETQHLINQARQKFLEIRIFVKKFCLRAK